MAGKRARPQSLGSPNRRASPRIAVLAQKRGTPANEAMDTPEKGNETDPKMAVDTISRSESMTYERYSSGSGEMNMASSSTIGEGNDNSSEGWDPSSYHVKQISGTESGEEQASTTTDNSSITTQSSLSAIHASSSVSLEDIVLPPSGIPSEAQKKRRDAHFKIRDGKRSLEMPITTVNHLASLAEYIDRNEVQRLTIKWKASSSHFRKSLPLISALILELSRITTLLEYLKISSDGVDWQQVLFPNKEESPEIVKSSNILLHHWHKILHHHRNSLNYLVFNNRAGPEIVIDLLHHLPKGLLELDISETDGTHHSFVPLLLYRMATSPKLKTVSLINTSLMPCQRYALFDGLKQMGLFGSINPIRGLQLTNMQTVQFPHDTPTLAGTLNLTDFNIQLDGIDSQLLRQSGVLLKNELDILELTDSPYANSILRILEKKLRQCDQTGNLETNPATDETKRITQSDSVSTTPIVHKPIRFSQQRVRADIQRRRDFMTGDIPQKLVKKQFSSLESEMYEFGSVNNRTGIQTVLPKSLTELLPITVARRLVCMNAARASKGLGMAVRSSTGFDNTVAFDYLRRLVSSQMAKQSKLRVWWEPSELSERDSLSARYWTGKLLQMEPSMMMAMIKYEEPSLPLENSELSFVALPNPLPFNGTLPGERQPYQPLWLGEWVEITLATTEIEEGDSDQSNPTSAFLGLVLGIVKDTGLDSSGPKLYIVGLPWHETDCLMSLPAKHLRPATYLSSGDWMTAVRDRCRDLLRRQLESNHLVEGRVFEAPRCCKIRCPFDHTPNSDRVVSETLLKTIQIARGVSLDSELHPVGTIDRLNDLEVLTPFEFNHEEVQYLKKGVIPNDPSHVSAPEYALVEVTDMLLKNVKKPLGPGGLERMSWEKYQGDRARQLNGLEVQWVELHHIDPSFAVGQILSNVLSTVDIPSIPDFGLLTERVMKAENIWSQLMERCEAITEESDDQKVTKGVCTKCGEPATTLFMPCRHLVTCDECSKKLTKCNRCKEPIKRRIVVQN